MSKVNEESNEQLPQTVIDVSNLSVCGVRAFIDCHAAL